MKTHTIDATDKKLGRIATEAAHILMGKDDSTFERHEIAEVEVRIVNVAKLIIDEKKRVQKIYTRYSGYPGGIKQTALGEVVDKKGYSEIMRTAVRGMLPKNTHRDRLMRKLIITE